MAEWNVCCCEEEETSSPHLISPDASAGTVYSIKDRLEQHDD